MEKTLSEGNDVILEIEYMGAFKVKAKFPEAVLIFLCPPSVDEVYARLKKRGTETEEIIRKRLVRGKEEAEIINNYDYIIVNDVADEAAEEFSAIITAERCRASNRKSWIFTE